MFMIWSRILKITLIQQQSLHSGWQGRVRPISAVERSGMSGLAEGMKVTYDVEADRKSGKESTTNLKVA